MLNSASFRSLNSAQQCLVKDPRHKASTSPDKAQQALDSAIEAYRSELRASKSLIKADGSKTAVGVLTSGVLLSTVAGVDFGGPPVGSPLQGSKR